MFTHFHLPNLLTQTELCIWPFPTPARPFNASKRTWTVLYLLALESFRAGYLQKLSVFEVLKIECIRKVLSAFICQKAKGCSVCGLCPYLLTLPFLCFYSLDPSPADKSGCWWLRISSEYSLTPLPLWSRPSLFPTDSNTDPSMPSGFNSPRLCLAAAAAASLFFLIKKTC